MRKDLSLIHSLFGEIFYQKRLREEFVVCYKTLLLFVRNLEWLLRCQSFILLHPKLDGVVPEVIAVQSKVSIRLNDVLF
jgi:hypothetical protein